MSVTTYAGCACCGGSGSGSGSGDGGSGSGGGRYQTCGDCFGAERPFGVLPATLTVTYLDHGGATVVMTLGGGNEYLGDASVIPYLEGMYAQTALCAGGLGSANWFFKGCTTESVVSLEMVSCNPVVLYGATPFGTVTITEDGSSPGLPSLGSTAPGCDGISGTLDVTVSGGPGCLPNFQAVRGDPGLVGCNQWAAANTAPGCSCPDTNFALTCTGAGTWAATFGGAPLTLTGQTAAPFSLTLELPGPVPDCGIEIPAGTVFVVTEA